jgi:hypothetical protein
MPEDGTQFEGRVCGVESLDLGSHQEYLVDAKLNSVARANNDVGVGVIE